MYLVRAKVLNYQFDAYVDRLLLALSRITSLEELRKYKLSVRQMWAQASTDERLHLAEKVSAEYRYLYDKYLIKQKDKLCHQES